MHGRRHRHEHGPDCPPWHHHHAARGGRHGRWRHRRLGMRRQLFVAFGFAILVTALAGFAVVRITTAHGQKHPPGFLVFIVIFGTLWTVAGLWARRFARPIIELTDVARDLGDGRLERRAALPWVSGEIGELAAAMNEMAERLEVKLRTERELLATVSHELRTPLSRVRLLCELGRGATGRDVLAEIERESVEMESLVADLLAAARVDFKAVSPRDLDAATLARDALARHKELTGAPSTVTLENAAPGATVRGDATLLARAIGTLLDNAHRHAGGATVLRILRHGSRIAFEVDDAGPGFTDLSRAFEPFAENRGGGTPASGSVGLGLSIVRRIADAHGGRAYAENLSPGARVGFEVGDGI